MVKKKETTPTMEEKTNNVNEALSEKLEDIEGIGPVRLKKLYSNGIYTVDDLLCHGEESLARMLDIGWDEAKKLTMLANETLNTDEVFSSMIVSGKEYYDYYEETIKFMSTGLEELDEITGGYESSVITEFFGAFGSGKTQFMMVAGIMAQLPKEACCLHCGKSYVEEEKPKDEESYKIKLEFKKSGICECGGKVWKGGGFSKWGKPSRVVYIDTENSYRGKRVYEIVCNRDLILTKPQTKTEIKQQATKVPLNKEEHEKAMQFVYNIDISRPRTSALQMMIGNNLSAMLAGELCKKCHKRDIGKDGLPTHQDNPKVKRDKDGKLKAEFENVANHDFEKDIPADLVIIDSLTGKFRKEFEGRGTLSDRQMKLKSHVKLIEGAIEGKNVVCLVTNQVSEKMDLMGSGDNIRPVGGNEIGHIFTHRIYLRKPQSMTKDKITAILVDSPNKAKNEVALELGAKGIQELSS